MIKPEHLCGPILAAVTVMGLLLSCGMAVGALAASPGNVLFAALMLLVFFLASALVLLKRPLFSTEAYTALAIGLVFLALCLRLALFDHRSQDYNGFLSIWTETMRNMSARTAMVTPIGDYNMPYLYFILLVSRLPVYDLYCIKLYSVMFDLALALAVGYLAKELSGKPRVVLLAFAAALFAPTAWLNSAYWGQCDSVYTAFALWGLYCGLKDRPVGSMVLFALSLAFKLQAVFILPIVLFLLLTQRVKLRHLPVFPAAFLAVMLPAILCGRSLADTFSIYLDQTGAYPYFSLNAPSFWVLFPNEYFPEFMVIPVMAAIAGVILLLFVFLPKYEKLGTTELLELSLIFSLMIPWLLPRMHERYFFLPEMLSVVYAARYPRRMPVCFALLLGGLLIYCPYLFGTMPVLSMQYIAVIYGAILAYLLSRCYRRVFGTKTTILEGGNSHGKN